MITINNFNTLPKIKNSLIKIATLLNDNNILWALGGSLLLFLEGYKTNVNDIDIIVHSKDSLILSNILSEYKPTIKEKNDIYLTESFHCFEIDEISIDIMSGFKVKTEKGIYTFYEERLIQSSIIVDGVKINLSSIEEWSKAYTAMSRLDKIELLKK